MTAEDVAGVAREILDDDPNVVSCEPTPEGIRVTVYDLSKKSGLRRIFGYQIEYVELPKEES